MNTYTWGVLRAGVEKTFRILPSPPETIGVPNVMFLYAIMSFVLLIFVILFVPETKGRTLEQISKELAMKYVPAPSN